MKEMQVFDVLYKYPSTFSYSTVHICCLSTLNIVQIIGISHNETKVKLGKKLKSQQSCDTVPLKGGVGGVI